MYKLSENQILSHSGLLDGSITNHTCDPKMNCPECKGKGVCNVCHGRAKVTCQECNGRGYEVCDKCGGSGTCRRCGGSGLVKCSDCHGNGEVRKDGRYVKCKKCNGRGESSCPSCTSAELKVAKGLTRMASLGVINLGGVVRGSGKCSKCNGTGQLICDNCIGTGKVTCEHCSGTGKCPNCKGSGKVTCTRCNGSGWYQTYKKYTAFCNEIKWEYFSSDNLAEGLRKATGKEVYSGTFKKWKSRDEIAFDNTEDIKRSIDSAFENESIYSDFYAEYKATSDSVENSVPYSKIITATKIHTVEIKFHMNGKDYTVYVMGDNSVVLCGDLPSKIEIYAPSFWKRIKMIITYKRRYKAYLKLAAYIFQCDGRTMDESHVLTTFLNDMRISNSKKLALSEDLKRFNNTMAYEELRKHIKPLFTSKKALTFAWQCMAVDKNLSPHEEELFARLGQEYKNLKSTDIDEIKRFANKYSLLKDDYLVKEYLS